MSHDLSKILGNVELALTSPTGGNKDKPEVRGKKCNMCPKAFSSLTLARRHLMIAHLGCKYLCPACQYSCKSHDWFKAHVRGHVDAPTPASSVKRREIKTMKCAECDFTFKQRSALDRHVQRVHKGTSDLPSARKSKNITSDDKSYLCERCPNSFASRHRLKSHQELKVAIKTLRTEHDTQYGEYDLDSYQF